MPKCFVIFGRSYRRLHRAYSSPVCRRVWARELCLSS